jgi:hypothetical protein
MAILEKNLEKPSRRLTPFHQYLKMYYEERVKDEYTRRFQEATKRFKDATDEERELEIVKEPWAVKIRNEVGKEFWDKETEEFRKEVARVAEDVHAKELEVWEDSKLIAKTPQQHHQ